MSQCIFCQIAAKKSPAKIFYEDKDIMAFQEIRPRAPVHVLIIPKKHIESVNQIAKKETELLGLMIYQAKALAKKFGIAQSGYKLIFNCGKAAGQIVDHLHLHLLGGADLRGLV